MAVAPATALDGNPFNPILPALHNLPTERSSLSVPRLAAKAHRISADGVAEGSESSQLPE
jgi:hypothetical protein